MCQTPGKPCGGMRLDPEELHWSLGACKSQSAHLRGKAGSKKNEPTTRPQQASARANVQPHFCNRHQASWCTPSHISCICTAAIRWDSRAFRTVFQFRRSSSGSRGQWAPRSVGPVGSYSLGWPAATQALKPRL